MKKLNILFLCFFVSLCLFAQSTKLELEKQIKDEISSWTDNCSYKRLSEDEVCFVVDTLCKKYSLGNDVNKKTKSIKNTYELFCQGVEAINNEYNKETVEPLIPKFSKAIEKENNDVRQNELSEIHQKLNDYSYASGVFTELKNAIDEQIKTHPGNEWKAISEELKQQTEDGYIEEIENNPYLNSQYHEVLLPSLEKYKPKQPTQTRRVGTPRRR